MFFMPLGFFLLSREEDWSWTAPQLDELCICLGVHEVPKPKNDNRRRNDTDGHGEDWGFAMNGVFLEYFKTQKASPRVSWAAIPKRPRADQLFRTNYASSVVQLAF